MKEDITKFEDLDFSSIKQLVAYYQIENILNEKENKEIVNFSVTFDKNKIHDLFYKRGILYSEISNKELYTLPILVKDDEVFIFNNNFFYTNWNEIYNNDLIEFILPLENIEIIKNINNNKLDLMNLDLGILFKEYSDKNLALVLIEEKNKKNDIEKIYIKTIIQGKRISKSKTFSKQNLTRKEYREKIIIDLKEELINLVKSKNLIDIRTPSFLNVRLILLKNSNLVELKSRVKNIDLIENIFVSRFNKDYMDLRIKYLGKLDKMINQLKKKILICN